MALALEFDFDKWARTMWMDDWLLISVRLLDGRPIDWWLDCIRHTDSGCMGQARTSNTWRPTLGGVNPDSMSAHRSQVLCRTAGQNAKIRGCTDWSYGNLYSSRVVYYEVCWLPLSVSKHYYNCLTICDRNVSLQRRFPIVNVWFHSGVIHDHSQLLDLTPQILGCRAPVFWGLFFKSDFEAKFHSYWLFLCMTCTLVEEIAQCIQAGVLVMACRTLQRGWASMQWT